MIKVNNIFSSIQGEGRFQGYPVLFIRMSGCNRECTFCDTKYHDDYLEGMTVSDVVLEINKYAEGRNNPIVVFTGGEPLLQLNAIQEVLDRVEGNIRYCLETNGDFLLDTNRILKVFTYFDYVCVSPKTKEIAKKIEERFRNKKDITDIKVVTDLDKIGIEMIQYATMLMPLTTDTKKLDGHIKRKVWDYCINRHIFYSGRIHVNVWGTGRRGI